ncbi:hypothetical protein [Frankia sp. Cppng1_Ct_nod]|uniref:HoxN/HupN/NixA family nickel/cobalt transporter n=1 Tax=Frankia sp. Cppng1_Ct_nod TaxID=2897162 RepID=UPI001041259A|nr:hypothetical protein [Frankia sp. Cppng1_Ct_nod]
MISSVISFVNSTVNLVAASAANRGRRAGRRILARVAAVTVVAGVVLLPATAANAHPLGNLSVNTASVLRIQPDEVLVDLIIDMAEIPTQQTRQALDLVGPEQWSRGECVGLTPALTLSVGEARQALVLSNSSAQLRPGTAGLPTLRVVCRYTAARPAESGSVSFSSQAFTDRIGWKEIVAFGDRTTIVQRDVPDRSPSRLLTDYPADLLSSPVHRQTATLRVHGGGPAIADPLAAEDLRGAAVSDSPQRRGADGLTAAFTNLVGRHSLTLGFALFAAGLALVLGAAHAFAPGHGKTMMAAYLVSERGTLRQVGLIGLTVTATHTVGVLLLGVALSLSTTFAPERFYPWLNVISGVLLLVMGAGLLRAALARRRSAYGSGRAAVHPEHDHADHTHADHGAHDHGAHGHDHGDHHHHHHGDKGHHHVRHRTRRPLAAARLAVADLPAGSYPAMGRSSGTATAIATRRRSPVRRQPLVLTHTHGARPHTHVLPAPGVPTRSLVTMGLVGGLVPSPSALVVLVGAIALHRAWFGVLLVLLYGAGMATTLVGIGGMLSRSKRLLDARVARRDGSRLGAVLRWLPVATGVVVLVGGLSLVLRGVPHLLL